MIFPRSWFLAASALVLGGSQITGTASAAAASVKVTDAPDYVVSGFDIENGLPDSSIKDLAQTADGYLWVATTHGLARFDGARFTVFNAQNTPLLSSDECYSLLADAENGLWIGTSNRVVRYRAGQFEIAGQGETWATNRLVLVFKDAEGGIWLRTRSRSEATAIRFKGGQFSVHPRSADLSSTPATIEATDKLNRSWSGTAADAALGVRFSHLWLSNGIPVGVVGMASSPARDGGLWFLANERLRKVKEGKLVFDQVPFPLPDRLLRSQMTAVFEDSQGCLWIGAAGGGIYRLLPDGSLERLASPDRPLQHRINCFFEDSEGNLWAGTDGGGLLQVRRRQVKTLLLPEDLQEYAFTSVCNGHNGTMWAGTDGGGVLSFHNREWTRLGEESGLPDPHVFTVFEDSRSNLWAGTTSGLFVRRNGRFREVGGPGQIGRWVCSLYEDRAGTIWVGSYGTLSRIQGERIETLTEPRGKLPRCEVPGFAEDAAGNFWIATTHQGLVQWTNDEAVFWGTNGGLDQKDVRALLADADGTLWVGMAGHGLYRFQQGKFTHYSTADGLPDNRIQALLNDGSGNLWVASMDGIFGISKADLAAHEGSRLQPLKCRRLSLADGLVSRQCSGRGQPTAARAPDGSLWIPNMHGLAVFNPDKDTRKPVALPVQIEELLVNNQPCPPDAFGRVRLKTGPGLFEFHFTALEFAAPDTVRFRYCLDGLDKGWVDAGARRVAYYGTVPAGRYRFRVMASSGAGEWCEAAVPLNLEVVVPLWQRGWFQIAAVLALAGLVAITVRAVERARTRRRIQQLETQQALEKERRRIAQDIHDDIGSRLSSLTMLGEMTAMRSLPLEQTRQRVAEMTTKTRELGRAMDEIIWTVNPRNDTLPSLVSYLQHFTTEYLSPTTIRLRVDVPAGLPPVLLRAQVRHNLFLAAQEAVHNVASHSGATEVWIRVKWTEPVLSILIEDNGHGFDPGAASTLRNGLANMDSRLAEIGGRCAVESRPGQGCLVSLTLPLPDWAGPAPLKFTTSRDGGKVGQTAV